MSRAWVGARIRITIPQTPARSPSSGSDHYQRRSMTVDEVCGLNPGQRQPAVHAPREHAVALHDAEGLTTLRALPL
jgi:hypothetical protein